MAQELIPNAGMKIGAFRPKKVPKNSALLLININIIMMIVFIIIIIIVIIYF